MASLQTAVTKALGYLLDTQLPDGEWSGPYSTRIRETYLAYLAGKLWSWPEVARSAERWLTHNRHDLGDTSAERLLNSQFIQLLDRQPLNLTSPELYADTLVRKTLQIVALAIVENIPYSVPPQFADIRQAAQLIEDYLAKHQHNMKQWAAAEFVATLIILRVKLRRPTTRLQHKLIRLQDQSNNWYHNPNTTLFSLIALAFAQHSPAQLANYLEYVTSIRQTDGGWSFCPIPVWGTGLSLSSLSLAEPRRLQKWQTKLAKAKAAAINYIEASQNADGGWGFVPGLESESDTSAIVLHAITRSASPSVTAAVNYYRNLQFRQGEYVGLWPVWRHIEVPSLEVVAHSVSALATAKADINLEPAKTWINHKINSQQIMADWGRSLPYSIYAVLNTGLASAKHPLVHYLLAAQNSDGGWGNESGMPSNASASANAVMALKLIVKSNSQIKHALNNGLSYLITTQLADGTWPRVKEVVGSRPYAYADDCSTHNFALQALLI